MEKINRLLVKLKTVEKKDQIKLLLEISKVYFNSDNVESIKFAEKARKLSIKLKQKNDEIDSFRLILSAKFSLGKYREIIEFVEVSMKKYQKTNNIPGICLSLSYIGKCFWRLGNYEKSLKYYYEILVLLEDKNDEDMQINVLNSISLIHISLERYKEAEKKLTEVKEALLCKKNDNLLYSVILNLGLIAYKQQQYNKAKKYTLEAYELANKLKKEKYIAASLNNLAAILMAEGNYSKALEKLIEGKAYFSNKDFGFGLKAELLNNIAECYIHLDDFNSAEYYVHKSLDLARKSEEKELVITNLKTVEKLATKQKNYNQAYKAVKELYLLESEKYRDDTSTIIKIQQIKYELEEHKKMADILKASKEKYRTLTETMKDVVVRISPTGKLLYISPSVTEFSGYIPEEEIGNNISKYISKKSDLTRALKLIAEVLISKKSGNFEYDLKPKYGDPFPVEHTYVPLIKNGKVYAIQLVIRDISERKLATEKLKASEERFRSIFSKISNIAVQGYNKDRKVTFWNNASEKFYGYSKKEAMNRKFENLIIPAEMRADVISMIKNWHENDIHVPNGELTLMKKDKTPIQVLSSHVMIEKSSGEKEMFCIDIDITKRKLAEKKLKNSEEKYRLIFENKGTATAIIGKDMVIRTCNTKFIELLGYSKQEIEDKMKWPEIIAKEDLDRMLKYHYQRITKTGNPPTQYECGIIKKSGKKIYCTLNLGLNGSERIVTLIDVSELKRAKELYYTTVNSLSNPLQLLDSNLNIVYVNKAFKQFLKYTEFSDQVIGKNIQEIFSFLPDKVFDECNQVFATGKEIVTQEVNTLNKKEIHTITKKTPVIIDGKVSRVIVTIEDITQQKKAEETLLRRESYLFALNKAKEVLLTSKSKNPFKKFVDILGPISKASRTYVFINHRDENGDLLMNQKAEYCIEGITPKIDSPELQNLRYSNYGPRWKKTLSKGEMILGKIKDFPKVEKTFLESQDIKAILIIPIMQEKDFIGFIGFDNCTSEKEWESVEQSFLHAAAGDLAQFIERKRSQEQLQAEFNRFQTTLDAMDAVVYVADIQTHELLFLNQLGKKLTNANIGEKCFSALQKGQTKPCKFCTNHLLLDKKENPKEPYIWEFQNTITKKWYQCRDQAIHWSDGRIVRLEIATDITTNKKVETELKSAKEFAENLLETANSIVVMLDTEAHIITFNKFAEDLTGYTKEEVVGKNWIDIFIPDKFKESVQTVLSNKLKLQTDISHNENPIIIKNGKELVINWRNNLIQDKLGNASGILSIGNDVTERNKARNELYKYAETQKVLLREVNHRVKNNLSALISMLHKVQDHAETKGLNSSTVLAVLEERINGLANVHSLLSESGWKPINLSMLCKQIIGGSISNLLLTRKVDLTVGKSEVMIDSDQAHHLTMVLNELSMNTFKYALANRNFVSIKVDIKQRKENIQLCFADNGAGYPKKMLEGDFSDIGIGFELISGIIKQSMGGKVQIVNNNGATTIIDFQNKITY